MKKFVAIVGIIVSISSFCTGCSSSNKNGNLPPMYYDYSYQFDETTKFMRYKDFQLINTSNSTEHKHEYIKFDYRNY